MVHELGARRAASLDPGKRWIMAALGVSALLCVAALAPAAAQQKGAEGQGDSKDVIVDLSALDQLGSSPSAPGGGTIVLTPPGLKPGKKPAGKAQPAAVAKGRVAAKPAPAAAKASSPPPPPPQSAAAAPAAESHAPDSTASAAPAIKTKASESPALAASAAVQEKSAPTLPTTESTPPEGAPPDAAGAAGAAPPEPPAAAVVAGPGSAPPQPAGANRAAPAPGAAPAVARPQSATPPQLAAKPSALPVMPSASSGEKALSLSFDSGAAELTDAAKGELGKLAASLKKSSDQRLQVVAYAAGTDAEASRARRLALSRALAVRSYLIEQGVGSARMDVRALGNKIEGGGPADRVDLMLIGNK
jgi:outer membrane protein OmpA-like peptidoglycan-associated protein